MKNIMCAFDLLIPGTKYRAWYVVDAQEIVVPMKGQMLGKLREERDAFSIDTPKKSYGNGNSTAVP